MIIGDGAKKLIFAIASAIVFCWIIFPQKASAEEITPIISEVYPNPESGPEWIELFNPADIEIDLTDFTIEDGTHKEKELSGQTIAPKSYLTLYKSIDFTFGLNNDSDQIILKKVDQIVDGLAWGTPDVADLKNYQTPQKGFSLTRKIPQKSNPFEITLLTENSPFLEIVYPKNITINEIYPTPLEGADFEFIEIKNLESFEVNLKNYSIDDIKDGGSSPYRIDYDLLIPSNSFVLLKKEQTKIAQNDDGDMIRLIAPDNQEIDRLEYQKSQKGQSYSKFDNGFFWTTKITAGEENILELSTTTLVDSFVIIKTLIELKNLSIGVNLVARGVVTATPKQLSNSYFYIQDKTFGVQIYSYHKDFPKISSGDFVEISGTLSITSGQLRIKTSSSKDIKIIKLNTVISPQQTTLDNIAKYQGKYVEIFGEVIKPSGSTFYIKNNSSQVKVIVKKTAGVNKPRLKTGYTVKIKGIVSIYKSEFRILPIMVDGVTILYSGLLPQTGMIQSTNKITIVWKKSSNKISLPLSPPKSSTKSKVATAFSCVATLVPEKQLLPKK